MTGITTPTPITYQHLRRLRGGGTRSTRGTRGSRGLGGRWCGAVKGLGWVTRRTRDIRGYCGERGFPDPGWALCRPLLAHPRGPDGGPRPRPSPSLGWGVNGLLHPHAQTSRGSGRGRRGRGCCRPQKMVPQGRGTARKERDGREAAGWLPPRPVGEDLETHEGT